MKDLNFNEIQQVSGGRIRPSQWMWSGALGALAGGFCATATAFAAHPIQPAMALSVGTGLGLTFHAVGDILHEYDL